MAQVNLNITTTAQTPSSGKVALIVKAGPSFVMVDDTGTEFPLETSTIDQTILDALTAAQSPTGSNPYITLSQLQEILGRTTGLLYGGSVQWSGTGLVFNISTTGYFLNGQFYEEPAGQVTLAASDPTDPRIDVFYVDANGFDKLTGTPAATPVKPSIDPVTQIELSFVTIDAAATEPTITNENVYLENTEWTTSSGGTGTFDPNSTADPFSGTKSFEATSVQNGGFMLFTRGSDIDLTNYVTIGLQIKLKATMNNGRNVFVQFFDNSDNPLTNQASIPIVKNNSSTYQFASINLSQFTFSDRTIVRKLKLTYNGSGGSATYTGFFVDNVILQYGISQPQASTFTQDEIDAIKGANNPSSTNVFATMDDVAAASYPEAMLRASNTVIFDGDYIIGNSGARSGNILFDFTGTNYLGATTEMLHDNSGAYTFPTEAVIRDFETTKLALVTGNVKFGFTLVDKTVSSEVVDVRLSLTESQMAEYNA